MSFQLKLEGNISVEDTTHGNVVGVAIQDQMVNVDAVRYFLLQEHDSQTVSTVTPYTKGHGYVNIQLPTYIKNIHETHIGGLIEWDTEYSVYMMAIDAYKNPSKLVFGGRGRRIQASPPDVTNRRFVLDPIHGINIQATITRTNLLPYSFHVLNFKTEQTHHNLHNIITNIGNLECSFSDNKSMEFDSSNISNISNTFFDDGTYTSILDLTSYNHVYINVISEHEMSYVFHHKISPIREPRTDLILSDVDLLINDDDFIQLQLSIPNTIDVAFRYFATVFDFDVNDPRIDRTMIHSSTKKNAITDDYFIYEYFDDDFVVKRKTVNLNHLFVFVQLLDVRTGQSSQIYKHNINLISHAPSIQVVHHSKSYHSGVNVISNLTVSNFLPFTYNVVLFTEAMTTPDILSFFNSNAYNKHLTINDENMRIESNLFETFTGEGLKTTPYIDETQTHYLYIMCKSYHTDCNIVEVVLPNLSAPLSLTPVACHMKHNNVDDVLVSIQFDVHGANLMTSVFVSNVEYDTSNIQTVFDSTDIPKLSANLEVSPQLYIDSYVFNSTSYPRDLHDSVYHLYVHTTNTESGQRSTIDHFPMDVALSVPLIKSVVFEKSFISGILSNVTFYDLVPSNAPIAYDVIAGSSAISNPDILFVNTPKVTSSNIAVNFYTTDVYDSIHLLHNTYVDETITHHMYIHVKRANDSCVFEYMIPPSSNIIEGTLPIVTSVSNITTSTIHLDFDDSPNTLYKTVLTNESVSVTHSNIIHKLFELPFIERQHTSFDKYYNHINDTLPIDRSVHDDTYFAYSMSLNTVNGQTSNVIHQEIDVSNSLPDVSNLTIVKSYPNGVYLTGNVSTVNEIPYIVNYELKTEENYQFVYSNVEYTGDQYINMHVPLYLDVTKTHVFHVFIANELRRSLQEKISVNVSEQRTDMNVTQLNVKHIYERSIECEFEIANINHVYYRVLTTITDVDVTTPLELVSFVPATGDPLTISEVFADGVFVDRSPSDANYFVHVQTKDQTTGQISDPQTFQLDVTTRPPTVANVDYTKSYEDGIHLTANIEPTNTALNYEVYHDVFTTRQTTNDVITYLLTKTPFESNIPHTLESNINSVDYVNEYENHYGYILVHSYHETPQLIETVIPNVTTKRTDMNITQLHVKHIYESSIECEFEISNITHVYYRFLSTTTDVDVTTQMELVSFVPVTDDPLTISKVFTEGSFVDRSPSDTHYFVHVQTKDQTTGQISDLKTFQLDVTTQPPSVTNVAYTKSYEDGIHLTANIEPTNTALNYEVYHDVFTTRQTTDDVITHLRTKTPFESNVAYTLESNVNSVNYVNEVETHYGYILLKGYHDESLLIETVIPHAVVKRTDLNIANVSVYHIQKEVVYCDTLFYEYQNISNIEFQFVVMTFDRPVSEIEDVLNEQPFRVFTKRFEITKVMNATLTAQLDRQESDRLYFMYMRLRDAKTGQFSDVRKYTLNVELPAIELRNIEYIRGNEYVLLSANVASPLSNLEYEYHMFVSNVDENEHTLMTMDSTLFVPSVSDHIQSNINTVFENNELYYGYIIVQNTHGAITTHKSKLYSHGSGRSSLTLRELKTVDVSTSGVFIHFDANEPDVQHSTLTTAQYYDPYNEELITLLKAQAFVDGFESNITAYVDTMEALEDTIPLEAYQLLYTYVLGRKSNTYSDVYVISYTVPFNTQTTFYLRDDFAPPVVQRFSIQLK